MLPQTVPSGTNFPLLPQPAPEGSPLQALGQGQEVRRVKVSSLGIVLYFKVSKKTCIIFFNEFGTKKSQSSYII